MRRLLPLLSLALLSVAAATPSAVLDARGSAVQIIARAEGKFRPICSGAVVKLERGPRVLTAGHCLLPEAPTSPLWALDHQGRLWTLGLEEWAHQWPKADYAVYRSVATAFLPALNIAKPCQAGESVWAWAGPLGLGLMLFRGEVAGALSTPYDPEGEAQLGGMAYSTLPITRGASGGLALNERGEAVGIVVGTFREMSGAFLSPLPR